jgi:hypothetical protein
VDPFVRHHSDLAAASGRALRVRVSYPSPSLYRRETEAQRAGRLTEIPEWVYCAPQVLLAGRLWVKLPEGSAWSCCLSSAQSGWSLGSSVQSSDAFC